MEFLKETDLWVANWKWILILGTALLSSVVVVIARTVLYHARKALERRQLNSFVRSVLALELENLIAWVFVTALWHAVLAVLELPAKAQHFCELAIQIVQSLLFILIAYKLADAVGETLQKIADKTENTLDDQLVPLARKTLKIFVVIFGLLIALQGFGFNVVSLLAGLGIGGLAIAFAAQDTVANVFGSITILIDQPFQVNDWIKVADTEGTVEEVGFRSTRIRTFYNSLVTIPNSVMAKEKIDNMGVRPTRRLRHVLGVTYDTSTERLTGFMDAVSYALHQNPKVLKDDIRVYFNNLGDFSLQILVQYFISQGTAQEELQIQQSVLLEIMQIAEKLDVSFAFPTQTLLIQKNDA